VTPWAAAIVLLSAPGLADAQSRVITPKPEAATTRYVEFAPSPGAFVLASDGRVAPILVDPKDDAAVRHAAENLQADIERVTSVKPRLASTAARARSVVVVGTLGRSALIRSLADRGKIDVLAIRGKWESTVTQVVLKPWPGIEQALVIAGSDRRGTAYGVYDLSEQIGVSPWYWWADVAIRHRDRLFVRAGRYVRGEPAVRYRGFFINDEAPALSGWAHAKFGGFNHEFYVRVFELLLRLKANFLWPAMWGNAFNDDDPRNPELANEYGVVMGTSHHEPMMRAHDEWRRYGSGPWNYAQNPEKLRAFWTDGIKKTAAFENILTLGMRGDGDAPMSEQANIDLLQRIVSDQRAIIAEHRNRDLSKVPQVWALYKEVQEYYEKGMRVPDDVTLLWSDDNWGNIRRLPTADERKRAGGAGIYYHFDYVGGPRNYKWLNTVPIVKVWEQMHLAWTYGATRIWIVNVGDIKPMEFPIQFFLDYAWDPSQYPAESLADYTRKWAAREFGAEHASEIADIVSLYTHYNSRRKPEMLEPRTYSLVNYHEAENVVADYNRLARRAEALYAALPPADRDAFFQLVLYPVKACAIVNELHVTAGLNRLYAVQGRASTNDLADTVRALFREDAELSRRYNEVLAGGKWAHMMDQAHLGYTYWQQPVRNAMPAVQEVQVPTAGELGVALEGSEASWPEGGGGRPVLPALSVFDDQPRYVDVYNRGREPFPFAIEGASPWLHFDPTRGTIDKEQRIVVRARWADVPPGTESGTFAVVGPGNSRVEITVPVLNPPAPTPENLDGFVEANGYVSMEASHFSGARTPTGREWKEIPGHGRTLSGVTSWPVTPDRSLTLGDDMRLDYRMYLFSKGQLNVEFQVAPTQKFQPGGGLKFAVAFDDQPPQVVNLHADDSLQAWEKSVGDGATVLTSRHEVAAPGYHTLKVWALDSGVVLQKIVVNTAARPRPCYLGPPESARGRR
jgi:hypothetical protein